MNNNNNNILEDPRLIELQVEVAELQRQLSQWQDKFHRAEEQLTRSQLQIQKLRGNRSGLGSGRESLMMSVDGSKKDYRELYKNEKKDRQRLEALVFSHEAKIEELKESIRMREKKIRLIVPKFVRESERRAALQDSVEEYEKRLISLEEDLLSSLKKEGERRIEAENAESDWKSKYFALEQSK